jgi:hypothetical protein
MRRRLFNIAAALSLLLCVAACVMWVRSYRVMDRVQWRNAGGWRAVYTASGHVAVDLYLSDRAGRADRFHGPRYDRGDRRGLFNWLLVMGGSRGDELASHEWAGFAWHERRNAGRGTLHAIAYAPFWFAALVTAALPAAWAATWWRSCGRGRRRERAGLCRACGYDLRGTPRPGEALLVHCPECGLAANACAVDRRRSTNDNMAGRR